MPKYDVKMQIDDHQNDIHLDVYQRVLSDVDCSDEELVKQAQSQFCDWALKQGEDWHGIAKKLPSAQLTGLTIEVAAS